MIDFDVVSDAAAAAAAGKRSRTAAPSPTVQLVRPSVTLSLRASPCRLKLLLTPVSPYSTDARCHTCVFITRFRRAIAMKSRTRATNSRDKTARVASL